MKYVEEPKRRVLDEALERRAVEFHGHDGPFMTIGLRMGLSALEHLDCRGWFDVGCRVKLRWRPPDSCVIDGIQSSTGCTMGKRNIEVVEGDGISATFASRGRSVTLTLRKGVLDVMRRGLDEDGPHEMIEELGKKAAEELFEIRG
ncbi:MAG TPA: formylmethanofuran dehydrogenase subunit E family protein [Candidatus Krumholzibacteriaceae bacterium]|nr:formylmethanofuran dehydrogenase subunit E family protein [Candidatus Krumholzibacteriaceae bacterium]